MLGSIPVVHDLRRRRQETPFGRPELCRLIEETGLEDICVGDAEKRAESLGDDMPRERLVRCRLAANLLADLDRIDDLRWGTEGGKFQGAERAVREWPAAFARQGRASSP